MIKDIEVSYGTNYKGTLFLPEGNEPHPCLILFHAWMGKDPFIMKKAEELVETLGIAAFVADLYGQGQVANNAQEAKALMSPLFFNREELRKRVVLAFETASEQEGVKKGSVGAIGFCFGGLASIELFRSGAPVVGVAAFHTLLGDTMGGNQAKTVPMAKEIKGRILILNGYLDPLVSAQDIAHFQQEMSDAAIDWQYNIYGKAKHAFTNPNAHDESSGLVFNQEVSSQAFAAMSHFFLNIF